MTHTMAGAFDPRATVRNPTRGLKRFLKLAIGTVNHWRPWRHLVTSGFRSGLLAIGESNYYRFPFRWVTVDWSKSDFQAFLTPGMVLPFASRSFRTAYSAHLIEHLDDPTLGALFRETYRILTPGGHIRLECPDAEFLRKSYLAQDPHVLRHFRECRRYLTETLGFDDKYQGDQLTLLGEISNYIEHDRNSGHIPVYASREEVDARAPWSLEEFSAWAQSLKTEEQRKTGGHNNALYFNKLERMLRDAGFSNVTRVEFGRTTIPGLSLNSRLRRFWDSIPEKSHRAFYSLYIEARKPTF
jgi:SAM-dependent methyltransferase